jgi:hypothetical protein
MYTLINAPVLGFDLARRDGGHLVADLVVRSLCLREEDLPSLASAHRDDAARDSAWLELAVEERATVAQGLRLAADRLAGGAPTDAVLSSLERLAVGDLDGLLRLVRHEVLDWTWSATGDVAVQSPEATAAAAVICDAAASAYAAERLSPEARRRLAAPWLAVCRRVTSPQPDLGPHGALVQAVVDRVATLGPADVAGVVAAVDAARADSGSWARAMHEASWAVELTGRCRPAAAAQMLLVQAAQGSVAARQLARGAWNLLSGVVHATVVVDLLPPDAAKVLVPPVARLVGLR